MGVVQAVDCLLSKCEGLSLNPSTAKKQTKNIINSTVLIFIYDQDNLNLFSVICYIFSIILQIIHFLIIPLSNRRQKWLSPAAEWKYQGWH
jgi:hypothetical protein